MDERGEDARHDQNLAREAELADQPGMLDDRRRCPLDALGEAQPGHQARKQKDREAGRLLAGEGDLQNDRKDHPEERQLPERMNESPHEAEQRAAITALQVAADQLFEEETVVHSSPGTSTGGRSWHLDMEPHPCLLWEGLENSTMGHLPEIQQVQLVGKKIRQLRKERHLTQTELSAKLGIQQSDLSRMEQGEYRVSLDTLFKVLAEFRIGVGEFFEDVSRETVSPRDMRLLSDFHALDPVAQEEIEGYIHERKQPRRSARREPVLLS